MILLCGEPVRNVVPEFAARTPVEAADMLKKHGEAVVVVNFPVFEESLRFALGMAELYRNKKFLLVTGRTASLQLWAELERVGVIPVHPDDIETVVKNIEFKPRKPVPVEVVVEKEAETLKEKIEKPVTAVFAGEVAVTSLKSGSGRSFVIKELAEMFQRNTGLPVGINQKGQGLSFFEVDFSTDLNKRYNPVLVVSGADEISLARLASLKELGNRSNLDFTNFYLVFNNTEKIKIAGDILPFSVAAIIPPRGHRQFDAEMRKLLSLVTGTDFLFPGTENTEKKRSILEVLPWKRRKSQQA